MENKTLYYGVDVSQSSLQIAFQLPDGTWKNNSVINTLESIDEWLDTLDLSKAWVVMEYTGTYSQRLAYSLNLRQAKFSILNPSQSSGFAKTLKNSSKTDSQDARLLSLYGQKMQPTATTLPDEKLEQKRQKYKYLSALKIDRQAFSNRMHALTYYPNPDPVVIKSMTETIEFLAVQIQKIVDELYTIDSTESQRLEKLMTNVVGIGKASANAIIVATNGFKEFDSAKQVSKFIGTAPTDKQSGSSVKGNGAINKSGLTYVRTILYLAGISAARFNNACRDLYQRLRAKGKPHKVAMVAVINKLIKQVFAVVKNDTIFDNNLCLTK
jgi:transposase